LQVSGIGTEFSGAITTQFYFTYTLEDVTAMTSGYTLGFAMHSSSFSVIESSTVTQGC